MIDHIGEVSIQFGRLVRLGVGVLRGLRGLLVGLGLVLLLLGLGAGVLGLLGLLRLGLRRRPVLRSLGWDEALPVAVVATPAV